MLSKAQAVYTVLQINLLNCKFLGALKSQLLNKILTNPNGCLSVMCILIG